MMPDERESLEARYERYREIVSNLTMMSDAFMRNVLKVAECAEYVLQVILKRKDLRVVDVIVQKDLKNLQGRSAVLDFMARDGDGSLLCIEVQQDNEGASPMRARFHSGLLDMNILDPGKDFEDLPETFTIFITRHDVLKGGLPIYHIERKIEENGRQFGDKAHIIYVNASIQDNTELGRLMHDFHCKRADEMYSKVLADRVRVLKEPSEEGDNMCRELEALYLDGEKSGMEKGRREGRVEGRVEGRAEGIISSLKSLMATLGMSVEEAMNALRIPENERGTYTDLLAKQ